MSDLQRQLKKEFGISLTYMETRMLVLDLGIQLQETPKPAEPKPETAAPGAAPGGPPGGGVTVSMDHLAIPGALVSGKVVFSDGQGGVWLLDQTGRLGFDPDTAGYRPSRDDMEQFQRQLNAVLQKAGF